VYTLVDFELTVIGHISIDHISLPSGNRYISIGGSPTYAGLTASILDSKVQVISKIGFDFEETILKCFKKYQIDVSNVKVSSNPTTSFELKYFKDWSRILRLLFRCDDIYPPECQHFNSKGYLISPICSEIPLETLKFFADIDGFKVLDIQGFVRSFDKNGYVKIVRSSFLHKFLGYFNVIKCSLKELKYGLGFKDPCLCFKSLRDLGVKILIVTLGSRGFYAFFEEECWFFPSYPISRIVDPTGCGDALNAGFLASILSSNDVVTAFAVGGACASLVAESSGLNFLKHFNDLDRRIDWLLKNSVKTRLICFG